MDMEKARKIVELENQANETATALRKISAELLREGVELKLSGWNADSPGSTVTISVQGSLRTAFAEKNW